MKKNFYFYNKRKTYKRKISHFVRWNKLFVTPLEKFENKKWKIIDEDSLENEDIKITIGKALFVPLHWDFAIFLIPELIVQV